MHIYTKDIIVKDGRRSIDQNKVAELAESIKDIGLLHPITVRAEEDGETYTLIAGAHRLEAYKLLKKEIIEAKIIMKDELETELIEIDENLIRNELDKYQRGDLLARKKEIYEELYPETKMGQAQALSTNKKLGHNVNEIISPTSRPSFVEDTASKTGLSKRTIETDIQISKNVIPEAKPILQEHKIPKTEATKLAREEPETQKKIIPLFESGQTKKVEEAKRIISPEEEYHEKNKEIDKRYDNHKLVADLINNMKFIKIDEECVSDYMDIAIDIFQAEFVQNCDRLINKLNEMKVYHSNLTKVRRVK